MTEPTVVAALRHYGLIVGHCVTERGHTPETTHRAVLRLVQRENGRIGSPRRWLDALATLDADDVADLIDETPDL
jgi:hypothetical protein